MTEYLTKTETARRLCWSTRSLDRRMKDGTFRRGVHWFDKAGMGVRFKWGAIVAWLEQDNEPAEMQSWEEIVGL